MAVPSFEPLAFAVAASPVAVASPAVVVAFVVASQQVALPVVAASAADLA